MHSLSMLTMPQAFVRLTSERPDCISKRTIEQIYQLLEYPEDLDCLEEIVDQVRI